LRFRMGYSLIILCRSTLYFGFSGVSVMKYTFYTIVLIALFLGLGQPSSAAQTPCPPTAPDAEGPFYKPDVPIRENTGSGLMVSGKVKSAGSCTVISGARGEWWQTKPQRRYDDEHRGAKLTSSDGFYQFETDFPPGYFGRPPHIHFKIFAPGHRTLTTKVYPKSGQSTMTFDFILKKD